MHYNEQLRLQTSERALSMAGSGGGGGGGEGDG